MALISIIIGLLFDRAFRHLHDLRDLSWFEYYSNAITRYIRANGVVQIISVLLFPVLIIAALQYLLSDFMARRNSALATSSDFLLYRTLTSFPDCFLANSTSSSDFCLAS